MTRLRAIGLAALATLPWAAGGGGRPLAAPPTEYEVKAAYLFYLASFVAWPDEALGPPGEPFVIAVIGEDPFGPVLEATLAGKVVHGRPLRLKRVTSRMANQPCHVAFVSESEEARLPDVLRVLHEQGALTVGDMENFVGRGGHIGLRMDERRVRFSINVDAAKRARLKVSAQLLKLASPPVGEADDHG